MSNSRHLLAVRYGAIALLLSLLFIPMGCDNNEGAPPPLYLYCGAGIRPPAQDLCEAFEKEYGVKVEGDYNGSELLFGRIKVSKKGDLFMPGDIHYVEMAEEAGLVGTSKQVCYFVPTFLVQKGNPKGIKSLRDLTNSDLRVGLGDPKSCAIGRKTKKMFEKNGIPWSEIEPNVKFSSTTVNELGTDLSLKHLDVVIVWDAVAANYPDCTIVPIPLEENLISTVPVATLKYSKNPEMAKKFVEFASSAKGQAIFKKHHYTTERPEKP